MTKYDWYSSNTSSTVVNWNYTYTATSMKQMQKAFAAKQQKYYNQIADIPKKPLAPKPRWGDRVKAGLSRVAGGPPKDVAEPPALVTPGGMKVLPIGGAASNAEITRQDEDLPSVPGRKKIVLTRTVPVKRQKDGRTQEVHSGKVTLVRTIDGPGHLTENISVKAEPDVTGSHVEIPIKDLEKAIKDLKKAG